MTSREFLQPDISVVLPAHDEAESLGPVVEAVASTLDELRIDFEIVIVDDGSRDATWSVILELADRDFRIRGVRLSRCFGHQAALLAGLRSTRGRAAITMDADGEHPPAALPDFVHAWREGHLIVQGVRSGAPDRGLIKRATSRLYYRLLNLVSEVPVRPGAADFRLLDRRALELIASLPDQTVFLRGVVPWLGLSIQHIEFDPGKRIAGRPSYTLGRMLRLSIDGILSSSAVPLRLIAVTGSVFSILAFLFLAYVVAVRFLSGRVVPGWASVAGLLTLLGGVQLLALGVLGEYVARIFTGSLGRPAYVVLDRSGAPGESPAKPAQSNPGNPGLAPDG